MTISKTISEFANAVEETRSKLAIVGSQISALESEYHAVLRGKPHSSDIVAMLLRTLDGVSRKYESQLSEHLVAAFVQADNAAETVKGQGPDLLRLGPKRDPHALIGQLPPKPELSVSALAYFLRDRIAEEIPDLVERLCPGASTGVTAEERQQKLAYIGERLAERRAEQSALEAELAAARAAVNVQ